MERVEQGPAGFSHGEQRAIAGSRDNRARGEARPTGRPQRRDQRSHERGHRTPDGVRKTKTRYTANDRPPAFSLYKRNRSVSEDDTNVPPRRWPGERSCGWAGLWPRARSRFWRGRKMRFGLVSEPYR